MLTSTSLIRWCALTAITLILSICGSCVAINRHSDDASVQRAPMEAVKSQWDSLVARDNADKAMFDHMRAKQETDKAMFIEMQAKQEADKAMWDHMPVGKDSK